MRYSDTVLDIDDASVTIHDYYWPGADHRIPLGSIDRVERRTDGRWRRRLVGTGDFRHWAHWDSGRADKDVALVLHFGGCWRPLITPDRPDEAQAVLTTVIS